MIKAIKYHPNAVLPKKASSGAAGFDLYATEWTTVSNHMVTRVGTGIGLEIPKGYYGQVAPRSGLAVNYGIDVLAGVIDRDFRGEISVLLTSHSGFLEINPGDRIAQIIFHRISDEDEIQLVDSLEDTERGVDGFGSTGV